MLTNKEAGSGISTNAYVLQGREVRELNWGFNEGGDNIRDVYQSENGCGVNFRKIHKEFNEQFGNIPGMRETFIDDYHGGLELGYVTSFIFDHRKIPSIYKGLRVQMGRILIDEIPLEFKIRDGKTEYFYAYQRYEALVDRCSDEIRKKLDNPTMTRDEMLDALSPARGDFKKWREKCKDMERAGRIPPYKKQ